MTSIKSEKSNELVGKASNLPLVPFEHYMLADDSPEFPMTFWVNLHVQGVFQRTSFQAAFNAAIERHPLLHSIVQGNPHGRTAGLSWHLQRHLQTDVLWSNDKTEFTEQLSHPIDISSQPGLRVSVYEHGTSNQIFLQAHHACTDAIGVLQFANELLTAYRTIQAGGCLDSALPKLDHQRLRNRAAFGLNRIGWAMRLSKDVQRLIQFFRGSAEPVAPMNSGDDKNSVRRTLHANCHCEAIDEDSVAQLIETARRESMTVNDLLLDELFSTLAAWNRTHDPDGNRAIRVGVPINLRSDHDQSMPVANMVSMVFVTHQTNVPSDDRRVLIVREMSTVKNERMGLTLCRVLTWTGAFPGGMRALLRKRDCFATAILSNLGEVFPNLESPADNEKDSNLPRLIAVDLIPPIRHGTDIAIGVTTFAGRMNVCLHFNQNAIDSNAANEILSDFAKRIRACGRFIRDLSSVH